MSNADVVTTDQLERGECVTDDRERTKGPGLFRPQGLHAVEHGESRHSLRSAFRGREKSVNAIGQG